MPVQAITTFRRAEFQGRNDKYAPPARVGDIPLQLQDVIRSIKPVEIAGVVLGDRYVQDSTSRLSAYREFWRYYTGQHFTVMYDGGDKKTPFNFCRKIVNKRANWIAGKGFSFYSEKGNEYVSDVLESVWRANGHRRLIRRTAKVNLTTGDAFWYFSVKTKDARGKILPRNQWSVSIFPINPSYAFPIWSEDDPSMLSACMLQFPVWGNKEQSTIVFTAFMTANTIDFYHNYEKVSSSPNPLGMIPVVHIPCSPVGDACFGNSTLEDIVCLNDEYNELSRSIRRIIKYHGEPTTLVYGAKLSQMEKGANKVWSNLPPPDQCRVENLEMSGDLGAMYKQLEVLENQIYHHGRTPKMSFDSEGLAISNTSGIAMQLMFQPLIEATTEDQDQFDAAIMRGNEIIAKMHEVVLGEDLSQLADNPETYLKMETVWHSMLPKDEQTEVDLAEKKIALGIWSKAEAARRLSGVKDTEKLALELAADSRYELALVAEKARSLAGQKPNFSASFLSSIFLSEDLLDNASQMADSGDTKAKAGGSDDLED